MIDLFRLFRMTLTLLALVTLDLATGCSKPVPTMDGPPASAPQVLLGSGALAFVAEPECGAVPVILYTQGGYHVWGSVLARYIEVKGVKLHFTMTDAITAGVINTVDYTVDFTAVDPLTLTVGAEAPDDRLAATCPDGGIAPAQDATTIAVPGGTDGWSLSRANPVITPRSWWSTGCPVHQCIDGHPIRIRVDLTDANGRTASDRRLLVPSMSSVPQQCLGGDLDAGIPPVDLDGFTCP